MSTHWNHTVFGRAIIRYNWGRDRIRLAFWKRVGHDEVHAPVIEWRKVEPESEFDETFTMGLEQAQDLMDSLWACGIRPAQGAGSAGSLAATERHLKHVTELLERALPSALRKAEPTA